MPTPQVSKQSAFRGFSPTQRMRNGNSWNRMEMCILEMLLLLFLGGLAFKFFLGVQKGEINSEQADSQVTKTNVIANESSSPSSISYQKVKTGKIESFVGGTGLQYEIFAAVDSKTNEPISVTQWANLMAKNLPLAKDITKIIQDTSYPGVFFETKGVSVGKKFLRLVRFSSRLRSFWQH